jgi:predicted DNA binding CopG/RHH family protein
MSVLTTSAAETASPASHPSQYSRMLEMRGNEETMNVGKKWTVEEDIKLAQEITDNKTFEEIAMEHKRTANSIKLRVISHIIYPKIKDNLDVDMENVALEYNVDTSQLIRHINKIIIKGEPKPAQKEYLPTNKEILDYLRKLDSKLDEINSKLDNLEYLR